MCYGPKLTADRRGILEHDFTLILSNHFHIHVLARQNSKLDAIFGSGGWQILRRIHQ